MPDHFHDPNDRKYMATIRHVAPDAFEAFASFDEQALRASTKQIPRKYTELMALAVALTTQCVYCIESHVKAAKNEGATQTEISETIMTAAALRAGGAAAHGAMAMKFYENSE
jgi:AhpD family alkylhydroperoxidase